MELDFLEDIDGLGENVIRLYNFDVAEAICFRDLIQDVIITKKQKLNLAEVEFIQARNCNLILSLFKSDEGILTIDNKVFYCGLTQQGYENMLQLIQPFCEKTRNTYQYLYDIDNPNQFLFTPTGTW